MADTAREFGLKPEEYDLILQRLNREPNLVELGVFSVMWSEHCSYKSSRKHLGKFPTRGPKVICGPGENAGVVDIGDGQACIFKMESHNHPSYIEPYQGAATGVGGIMRDVFTMGARPIALLNALRFGDPSHPKTRRLVSGVVAGIGGYGNCVGVPTVAGETNFHRGYDGNILVNAMCVGLADADKIFYSAAPAPGLPVVYFGSKTGRDGIHGATMASAEFDEDSEEKRPTVQVGDPFAEKLLLDVKPHLYAISSDYQPAMRNGDAWMAMAWTGDGKQLNKDIPEIVYVLGREGGEIRVTLEVVRSRRIKPEALRVSVWNEGPGFSPAQRNKLFRRFSRLDTPELKGTKGTGVGLYNSWRIVQLHRGHITAEAKKGEWAEFSFEIPVSPECESRADTGNGAT
jgi:hypothetical protein